MAEHTFEATFGSAVPAFRPLFCSTRCSVSFRPLREQAGRAPETVAEMETTPVTSPEEEAEARAAAIVAQAQAQAEEVLSTAEERARQLVEQTVAETRQAYVSAFAEASGDLLQEIERRSESHLEQLELQTATLVSDLVRRILSARLEEDPQAIIPIVRQALQELAESSHAQVVVSPQHGEVLREAYQELASVLSGEARLDLVFSETAEPLGCVVHGEHGSVDARLGQRLEAIEAVVQESIDAARMG